MCGTHYMRWKTGKPVDAPLLRRGVSLAERMAHYTGEPDANGCHPWIGGINKSGYPVVAQGGTGNPCLMAHRVAYELAGNKLDYRPIHHKCSNKMCVNPEHLVAVEPRENTAEMLERNNYLQRIAQLEAALAEFCPNHSLLC